MPIPGYSDETAMLRMVMSSPEARIAYSAHALEQIEARKVEQSDIIRILTYGHVVTVFPPGDSVWRVQGSDVDNRRIDISIVLYAEVIRVRVVDVS